MRLECTEQVCTALNRIYLVRHGETIATQNRVFEGSGGLGGPDDADGASGARCAGGRGSGLTREGMRQAAQIARALERAGVTRVYASPLRRTMETAEIVCARLTVEPVILSDLVEGSFGLWEGLTFDEIQARYPEQVEVWFQDPVDFTPPGGESVRHMADRACRCLLSISVDCCDQQGSAAVVTHGGPIRAILANCIYGRLDEFGSILQDPGAMNVLRCVAGALAVDAVNVTA